MWFELQLVDFQLLWIILIIFLLVVLLMVYQIDPLSNGKQETGNPVETADEPPLGNSPVQETQEPGIHPSMVFSAQLKEMRERLLAAKQEQANERGSNEKGFPEQCSGVEERLAYQEREVEEKEENGQREEQAKGVHPELLADPRHVVVNNAELHKGEEGKTDENGQQPSLAAEGPNVPGDVNHSDLPATAEATADAQTASNQEQPSSSGMTANPGKKRKGHKKKKKGKKVFAERSSSHHAAVADDPDTSTDESHHSSLEAFYSSDSDDQKQRSRK